MVLAATSTDFRIEDEFYGGAKDLRTQFDAAIVNSPTNTGMTPLTYAYCEKGYQFLTASAERIFREDSLDFLADRIRSWAADTLQASQTSTPQLRVYVGGCQRTFTRDNVGQPWHYVFWLSTKSGRIKILRHDNASARSSTIGSELFSIQMKFNQLLVHSTACLYSIKASSSSMNPCDGLLFLDGYLW
jgi:hypothetical protein